MRSKIQIIAMLALGASTIFTACKKNPPTGTGSMKLEFENFANGNTLNFNTDYTNANGEQMRFSAFKYYISNISFTKTDGSVYTVPKNESYFLCDQAEFNSRVITIPNVPAGDYKTMNFVVGVDSAKSVSPLTERTGVLDPAGKGADMYWEWNSGYIFVKAEGTCPQIPADTNNPNKQFYQHIGLFGGLNSATPNNIKTLSLSAKDGDIATVRTNVTPKIHTNVDVMEMFKTPTTINISKNWFNMIGGTTTDVANNYVDMFVIDHIHND
jgi:hypothetical protein